MKTLPTLPTISTALLAAELCRLLSRRLQARHDPTLFIANCLRDAEGRPIEPGAVHYALQDFLTHHARALVELPRDHGKSTQVCGRILWELGRNPALRVKIVCASDEVAAERSRFLRDAIEKNPFVRTIFPRLAPAEPWTAAAFTVRRPAEVIGPSVAAFGVGAASTGTRADLLVCDDVVDVRSLHSRAERRRVADFFHNNLMNLLEPDGRFWGLFTPWHGDDLNARLKANGAYALFRRAVGDMGDLGAMGDAGDKDEMADGFEPVWPAQWPAERLRARQQEIGAAAFARGYRLLPVAEEETPIRAEWIRFWTEPADYDEVILAVDPAVSTTARADLSALVVLGKVGGKVVGWRGCETDVSSTTSPPQNLTTQIHVLAARAQRLSTPELVNLIDEFDRQWNPSVILFESNAAFAGLRDLLVRQARFGAKLKGVTQTADKGARIAAFSVAVENGAFRLKGAEGGASAGVAVDAAQRELHEEMVTFPFGEHDDLVDAAATGTAYLLTRSGPLIW